MTTPVACLVAFSASTCVDLLMALWVAAVARESRYRAAIFSMGCATCLLVGIERIVPGNILVKVFWVLGYGVGTFAAITLAMRAKRKGRKTT